MSLYLDAKRKIDNINSTIKVLLSGNFPLSAGEDALRRLVRLFADIEKSLDRAYSIKSEASIRQYADIVNTKIYRLLPILGFILRSTNVRNAFELLDPFQVIAGQTLQGAAKILLSAEWDFVPFAYPQNLEELQSFVLIGMPASEASNSLLTPLAGHELGHAVWRNRGIGGSVNTTLQLHCENEYQTRFEEFKRVVPEYKPNDLYLKELLPESTELSAIYAGLQAEELFCDMFAYALFGESYLHSFAYILAPGDGRGPSPKYPTYKTRIQTLCAISAAEGVRLPDLKTLGLADEPHRGTQRERFIISVAENSVDRVKSSLWTIVLNLIAEKGVVRPDKVRASRHLQEIRLGIPAYDPRCLGDIIIFGWMHYKDLQADVNGHNELSRSLFNLNEIILKTVEVLEYNRRSVDGTKR